jgi:hypothetical protein
MPNSPKTAKVRRYGSMIIFKKAIGGTCHTYQGNSQYSKSN